MWGKKARDVAIKEGQTTFPIIGLVVTYLHAFPSLTASHCARSLLQKNALLLD
jgi:hypothetical protein